VKTVTEGSVSSIDWVCWMEKLKFGKLHGSVCIMFSNESHFIQLWSSLQNLQENEVIAPPNPCPIKLKTTTIEASGFFSVYHTLYQKPFNRNQCLQVRPDLY